MFKYFFKEDLHINKTEYIKSISKLKEENFLFPTKKDNLYILNPIMIKYLDSINF